MSEYGRPILNLNRKTVIIRTVILLLLLTAGCGAIDSSNEVMQSNGASSMRAVEWHDNSTSTSTIPDHEEWKNAGKLPKGLYDNAAAVWNGFLYISGGFGPGPYVNTDEIFIYKILQNGTVGLFGAGHIPNKPIIFANGAEGVVTGIDGHAMFAHNGYLYIVGGKFQYVRTDCYPVSAVPCFSPTPTAWNHSVLYTAINEDGTLSDWMEAPLPENAGPYTPGVTVANDHMYIIGGWDGERNTTTVASARLLPDGSPGPWNEEAPLPVGLSKHGVAFSGGLIYAAGGSTGMATLSSYSQGYNSTVYSARIEGAHSVREWILEEPLPDTWIEHKLIAVNEGLFIIGGRNVNEYYDYTGDYYNYTMHNTVLYSKAGHDGTLTPWVPYNNMPLPVIRHAATSDGSTIYLAGGTSGQDLENISCVQGVCSAPYIREDGIYMLDVSL